MKRLFALLAILVVLAPSVALAAATGLTLNPNKVYDFPLCAAGGSSSQTLTAGTYLMVVTATDTAVCYGATCASGGRPFPSGAIVLVTFPVATTISCRSTGSTGNLYFTQAQ